MILQEKLCKYLRMKSPVARQVAVLYAAFALLSKKTGPDSIFRVGLWYAYHR